jgi:exopolysaccharide production protein ExoQ
MVDSPSWMGWARAARAAEPPVPAERRERVTALGALLFAAAVAMLLIYSQGWLTLVQGDKGEAADSGLVRAMFFPAYGGAVVLLAAGPGLFVRALLKQPLLMLIVWIVAASAIWSINPDQTVRRAVALTLTTLSGVALAARWRWSILAEVVAASYALLAVASLVAALAFPSFGVMHELFPGAWRGLWVEKNALGNIMTIGFVVCTAAGALEPRRAKLWWPAAGLCALLVLASTSKTSLLACLLGGCGLLLVAIMRRGPVGRVVGTYGAVTALLLIAGLALVASNLVLAALGKDATLTGRTLIWTAVMRRIQDRPWLGYGYGAVWSDPSPWTPLAWIIKQAGFRPGHSHNSWLQQWLDLGALGLGAWALYFAETCTRAVIALYRSPGAFLAIPFLLVFAMTSLTESIAVSFNDGRWVLFVAIAVKLALGDEAPDRRPGTARASRPA